MFYLKNITLGNGNNTPAYMNVEDDLSCPYIYLQNLSIIR